MGAILVRYSEIGLKGKNRTFFENKLVNNIGECMKKNKIKFTNIHKIRGRIIFYAQDKAVNYLKEIFGISSISVAKEADLNLEEIKKEVEKICKRQVFKTFRISVQRLNKAFPLKSTQLEADLGSFVVEMFGKKVKLEEPDLNICVEITDNAYVFTRTIPGFGGLPISTQGRVVSLIEDKNSLLATILIMKRGCSVTLVGFKSFNVGPIKRFAYGFKVRFIKIKQFEDIDKIAKRHEAKALVVGQTLENIKNLETELLVLRPIVGYSKQELNNIYEQFGIK